MRMDSISQNWPIQSNQTESERKCDYPRRGFGERGEGEAVVGVDGELGVEEEQDGLLDRIQAREWAAMRPRDLHLRKRFRVNVHAKQNVLAAHARSSQCVLARRRALSSFYSFHYPLSLSLALSAQTQSSEQESKRNTKRKEKQWSLSVPLV